MKRIAPLCGTALVAVTLAACAWRAPTGPALPAAGAPGAAEAAPAVPLDVNEYKVVSADGFRGVFLKLTRLPDAVDHRSESDPARIIVDVRGPTGAEAPEQGFPGHDTLVSQVRISRQLGGLQIVIDLQADEPPPYSVHRMADWIMIRLAPMRLSTLPDPARPG